MKQGEREKEEVERMKMRSEVSEQEGIESKRRRLFFFNRILCEM